jgi:hydroxyquinol 1,2-dioxygenase
VFAVKEPLIVQFHKKPPGKSPTGEEINVPYYTMSYDFVLQPEKMEVTAVA